MGKFTSEMVVDYADKLLIGLKEEEIKMVLDEFEIIDRNINVINNILIIRIANLTFLIFLLTYAYFLDKINSSKQTQNNKF